MVERLKEYQSWYLENKDFYDHLVSHGSVLHTRFYPVYDVLLYLYNQYKDLDTLDEDIDKIMQVGLEYIFQQFFTCKIYLEKYFNANFHEFLKYDQIINYLLFIDDLRYELVEQKVNFNEKELDQLIDELESIVSEKKELPENINMYIDSKISDIVSTDRYYFHSIIDIFVEIGQTLGLDFDDEEDIVIGKDI